MKEQRMINAIENDGLYPKPDFYLDYINFIFNLNKRVD